MKFVDLKPYGYGIGTEIIETTAREVLFSSYKSLGDKYFYCLMIYNMDLNTCIEIYSYELMEDNFYSQYIHLIDESIVIVKTHNPHKLEIDIIDKSKGVKKRSHSIKTEEVISSLPIFINENYLIFYTEIESIVYLYDLSESRIYPIRDPKLIESMGIEHGRIEKFPLFSNNNQDYLIFNEAYMDDWEYEEVYEYALENKIDRSSFNSESLYYIELENFILSIKSGDKNIPFKLIKRKDLDGWIRYLYSDRNYIYYRDKDFSSQKEKIISMSKSSLKSTIIKEIDHSSLKGRLVYNTFSSSLSIYEENIRNLENEILVKLRGFYNFPSKMEFLIEKFPDKYRGSYSLFEVIENRFIIASGWYEDQIEDYYDIYYIKDLYSGEGSQSIGKTSIFENTLIVCETSVL